MIANQKITNWQKRTGTDRHGQPTRTGQDGWWWCAAEPKTVKLKIGDREVVSTRRAHVRITPGFQVGDTIMLLNRTWEIVEVQPALHGTLGHAMLMLTAV